VIRVFAQRPSTVFCDGLFQIIVTGPSRRAVFLLRRHTEGRSSSFLRRCWSFFKNQIILVSMKFLSVVPRKCARDLPYPRRYLAITSHEQVKARRLKKLIQSLIVSQRSSFKEETKTILDVAIVRYLSLVFEPAGIEPEDQYVPRKNLTIESFTQGDCRILFRFARHHLRVLCRLLNFPRWMYFANRSKMRGEEVFLRGLYELAGGDNQHKIAKVFGGDYSLQSRAFHSFIHHIYLHFEHLVHNNLEWWWENGFFAESARAIGKKMGPIQGVGNMIAFFIDCNCLPLSVTGGGPAEGGANAARWSEAIQRAFYNGWKSVHGLKHQTVDLAHGFTVDMMGPTSFLEAYLTQSEYRNI